MIDPRAAVDSQVLLVHGFDLHRQFLEPPGTSAGRTLPRLVVARAADAQHPAAGRHMVLRQARLDEVVLHVCSLAKNAAAFFKISRSIKSRAFSLRSRRSSAAIAPSPLGAAWASLPNFSIQYRTLLGSTPRLLAAS